MADEEKLRHYLKKATGELQRTARRLRDVELRDSEPIAIVGMGCRFPPDLRSAAQLWRFVAGGGDGISPFPADRGWGAVNLAGTGDDGAPRPAACQGGFVAGADQFDAGFFGIGEQEALAMDPQQRLLLETAWEAVEHAGMAPAALRGTGTGVYAGVSYCHYAAGPRATLQAAVDDHLVVGGSPSTTSGRVAYVLGLRGPAISIDTACSSSLVAVHLACQGLRRGDCRLALAGGVTIMATPDVVVEFGRRGALAPDGRCKPFAAAADGMGFGEGAGLLVLERLSAALRNGHPVLALIRGSAVNQDGATNGLTSPSRTAQEEVIRQALADAGLTADQVDAVEGHGTGTALGDSIEAEAVLAAYGESRTAERPLLLGSVKSNIGHTQAASGVASVIKMVMSMRAGTHARTLHIDRPSDYVDWSGGKVVPAAEPAPWPAAGHPRRAGVSSFGISGTNAHLVLEEPAAVEVDGSAAAPGGADGTPVPWVLSAKTDPALRAMAGELRDFVREHPDTADDDVGISLARTRTGFPRRAVSLGTTRDEHLAALAALAGGEHAPHMVTGANTTAGKAAVVFAGSEPDARAWRSLVARFPSVVAELDEVRAQLDGHLDGAVRAFLAAPPRTAAASAAEAPAGALPAAVHGHAVVFALQAALYRLICSFGFTPDLVAGSGIGAITAAHAAGVLSLADAGALVAAACAPGADGTAAGLRRAAERASYARPRIAVAPGGDPGQAERLRSPEYWADGAYLRAAAEDVLRGVRSQGTVTCLELGPGTVAAAGRDGRSAEGVLECLAEAYTAGAAVSWEAAFARRPGTRHVHLPGYPFQRRRYWLAPSTTPGRGASALAQDAGHPMLGDAIDLAGSTERRFTRTLTVREPWYVGQYRLHGTPALPSAAVAEWALAASRAAAREGHEARTVEDLVLDEVITFPEASPVTVQTSAETQGAAPRITGFSRRPGGTEPQWTRRFTASLTKSDALVPGPAGLDRLRTAPAEHDPGSLFARLSRSGVDYGPAFRRITRWWRTGDESLVLVENDVAAADADRYLQHPVVLETCFLSAMPLTSDTGLWLPAAIARLSFHRALPPRLWCHARRTRGDAGRPGPLDLTLISDAGETLAAIEGLAYRAVDPAALGLPAASAAEPGLAGSWDAEELSRLAVTEPDRARRMLMDTLFGRVTALLDGRPEDSEGLRERFGDARFGELGLDSLRAMRLRDQFRSQLSVDVPPQRLFGDATVADIVETVCRFLAVRHLAMTGDERPGDAGQSEELIL
ncbi:type I polyketide synthase [Actinomadura mexicana]|uniref:Acyl transferase domain-containing protein n=1 Tax=Actinomadura mexicana TaxID=134959 RepID=A0A238XMT1_9ACTN|nr:beta-ketoacyl synthase N-terminal-like domain-containing protein [Actinomadura mexicana]SNR59763.1 Acyl transferase domain-containing protein [Actinomadura mexicana]